jgi:hypothetical protein
VFTAGGATYLNQAANFTADNSMRSVSDWGLPDGSAFTFVAGVETPAAWINPVVAQYIFSTQTNLRAYLLARSPDHKLLFRLFDSSGTKIVEMLSTQVLATSTKYLIGVSWSAAAGNQMWIDGVAAPLDSSINLGGTANFNDGKVALGGRASDTTRNFQGRIGPVWMKNSRDDFATAWSNYHDGAGFLDAQNGAFTRMAWADFNSDGADGAAFEVFGGGSVPLEAW